MPDRRKTLKDVDRFLRLHGVSASAFGASALKDSAFVFRLRAGREPRHATTVKLYRYMDRVAKGSASNAR